MTNPIGAVLVADTGIGGIWPPLGLAAAGLDVYLPDESLRTDNTLLTNDYTMCIPAPEPMNAAAARASWSAKPSDRGS